MFKIILTVIAILFIAWVLKVAYEYGKNYRKRK